MRKSRKPVPVLVALNKSLVSRTKKLCGIFRASAESGNIELKIMDEGRDLTPEYVDREVANGTKAFIVGASGVSAALRRIGEHRLPLATISLSESIRHNACAIHTDNVAIAREAARTLSASGAFGSYAYYPAAGDPDWSLERAKGFLAAVRNRKSSPVVTLPRQETAAALLKLPRPIGILAANDTYAVELLDVCRKCGLHVPRDVSLVGVDNEELLCESAVPPLTSIEPDFEREGYEAAKAVIQLLGRRNVPRNVTCGVNRIIVRKSTVDERYATSLVSRALDYINEKAATGITVADVSAHLRVSRRLLSLRFRETKGFSPKEAIIARKLALLRKGLAETDLPIAIVCARCGFGSENHPKKLFRERFKTTMRDFRAAKLSRKTIHSS